MTTLNLIVTDAGRTEIVNATNTGTLPVVISEIALGTGRWTPDATASALNTEIKRINTIGGVAVADDTIHLTMADYSSDVYSLGEFGLYTDTGVLFAIYSDAVNGITDKAADAALLIATDTVFTTIPPGSITVNGAGFTNPPASETVPGVLEIADQLEVDTGTDHTRAVTPQTLASILSMYLLSAGYNAADVLAKLLTVDGQGSGLDADLFRGLSTSAFAQSLGGGDADLNVMVQTGMYRLGATNPNLPALCEYGQLLVVHGTSDSIAQVVFGTNNAEAYWRSGFPSEVGGAGAWSAWRRLWHTGNDADFIANNNIPTSNVPGGLKTKILDIVDWNMDFNTQKNVAHGLNSADIRSVSAMVRGDSDGLYGNNLYPITKAGEVASVSTTDIVLYRTSSGFFDSTHWDQTGGYVRGWIVVEYI